MTNILNKNNQEIQNNIQAEIDFFKWYGYFKNELATYWQKS